MGDMSQMPPTSVQCERPAPRQGWRWYSRIPLKWCLFSLVTLVVLFPNPMQLWRHVQRLSDYNQMIDPDAPELADWEREIREILTAKAAGAAGAAELAPAEPHWGTALSPRHVQQEVERFVLAKVQYAWDWDVWGAADYMPTVREMFERAAAAPDGVVREDCDGRAVMAASLMRRLGYQSSIVTDLRHVWVVTEQGEWMGPGRGKTMQSTLSGNELAIWATAANVPVSLSYGIAVFPLWRSFVILLAAWLLMWRRGAGGWRFLIGGMLLAQGLLFMRLGYLAPSALRSGAEAWPAWLGLAHMAAGFHLLLWPGIRRAGYALLSRRTAPRAVAGISSGADGHMG